MIDIFEIKLKVYLTNNILENKALHHISNLIDTCLVKANEYRDYHDKNIYKMYSHNSFYPIESGKIYKAGNIYTIIIRTVYENVYEYLKENLKNERTENIKSLDLLSYKLKENYIERIYSITPVIIKTENGYWRNNLTLEEYENRIKVNLIKKYNLLMENKLEEDFPLFTMVSFDNKVPIGCDYKNVVLLGDKLDFVIANNENAQKIAKLAIAVGIGEMNSRGYGFINYRYL